MLGEGWELVWSGQKGWWGEAGEPHPRVPEKEVALLPAVVGKPNLPEVSLFLGRAAGSLAPGAPRQVSVAAIAQTACERHR